MPEWFFPSPDLPRPSSGPTLPNVLDEGKTCIKVQERGGDGEEGGPELGRKEKKRIQKIDMCNCARNMKMSKSVDSLIPNCVLKRQRSPKPIWR